MEEIIVVGLCLLVLYLVYSFFAAHLWALWLLLGSIAAAAVFKIWYESQPETKARRERERAAAEEAARRREEAERDALAAKEQARREALAAEEQARKKQEEFKQRLLQMPTSTTNHLLGRRIAKQLRMVRVDGCSTDEEADLDLREAALEAGAGAIINLWVRPYPGGQFSAEGDAVTLQDD